LCERIYLQTDKQLYLAGEMLWLKVLTVTPERIPLSFSKIAYVELLDETMAHQHIKIKIVDGIGEGWIKLPVNLPTGYYRLIAYTRFMRNEGPDVFFEKNIGIVNTFQSAPSENRQKKAMHVPGEPARNTINLFTDKPVYATRERGLLQLDSLPEDIHSLSVSIAGKSLITIDGDNNILQWGKKIAKPTGNFFGKFIPEYEGHIVTGQLVSLDDSEIPAGRIDAFLSIPGKQPQFFVGKRNQSVVSFYLTDIYGTAELVTMVNTASENCRIYLQSPFIQHHAIRKLPLLAIDSAHLNNLLERTVAFQVSSPFYKDSVTTDAGNVYSRIEFNKIYLLDEYTRFPKMDELIIEFVQGVRFRMNNDKRELAVAVKRGNEIQWITPLVFMDGIPVKDHDLIFHYNPLLVEKIGVCLKEYLLGGIKYGGILAFSTYKYHYPDLVLDKTYQIVDYIGIQPHYSFFIPEYSDVPMRREPNFRHTLLWIPDVRTSGESSFRIPFDISDYTGEFLVTVEGLTQTGKLVYAKTTLVVNK
jgi:hypothetical protein